MSMARGAAPGVCQSCEVETTDIRLIPVQIERDGKPTIALVLACSPCLRRGLSVQVENGKATVLKAEGGQGQ